MSRATQRLGDPPHQTALTGSTGTAAPAARTVPQVDNGERFVVSFIALLGGIFLSIRWEALENCFLELGVKPLHMVFPRRPGRYMRERDRAFTLIEIMAVILILGIISTIVTVNVFDRIQWARVQTTKLKMRSIETNLDMFRFDQRSYPTTEEGLVALLERPSTRDSDYYPESGYLRDHEAIEDGWQRPFDYESPGVRSRAGFDLWSNGRDGIPGGDGVDRDITNWEKSS